MAKLLIAEDDKFLSKAYLAKFNKVGIEVELASDGLELIALAEKNKPKVILLDLIMPKMDGFTALELLKTNPKTKSIPVIVASNLGQQEDSDKAKALGAVEYIIKTNLSLDEIVQKVKSYF